MKASVFAQALLLGAALVACGKSNDTLVPPSNQVGAGAPPPPTVPVATAAPVVPGMCGANGFSMAGGPCVPTFAQACAAVSGTLRTISGVQVCKATLYFNYWIGAGATFMPAQGKTWTVSSNIFPRLNPDDPGNSSHSAYETQVEVKKGDVLRFTGSGYWGGLTVSSRSYLDGLFTSTTWSLNCREIDADGKHGSDTYLNKDNGYNAGLFGSDGTEAFFLGDTAKRVLNNNGSLKLGFNAPLNLNSCGSLEITRIEIDRCQDANYNTYTCN